MDRKAVELSACQVNIFSHYLTINWYKIILYIYTIDSPNKINYSLPMKNAADKGMLFPIIGLGTKGPGYKLGHHVVPIITVQRLMLLEILLI